MLDGVPDPVDTFEAWVSPHWPDMARLAHRLAPNEWEDVLQEALLSAWRKCTQFDQRRGTARGWLLAIVADQARKAARKRIRYGTFRPLDAEDGNAETSVAGRLDIAQAIERLAPRQRMAVELFYFVDLPIAEVAGIMSCSLGTVKSTLADARLRLSTLLRGIE